MKNTRKALIATLAAIVIVSISVFVYAQGPGAPGGLMGKGQHFGQGRGTGQGFGAGQGSCMGQGIMRGHGGMQRGPGAMCGMRGEAALKCLDNPEVQEKAGITEAQVAKIKAAADNAKKKGIELQAKIDVAQIELDELMDADSADRKAIYAKVDEISAIKTELQKTRIEVKLVAQDTLTADQKDKLQELRKEKQAEMREKFQEKRQQRGEGFGKGAGACGERGMGRLHKGFGGNARPGDCEF